MPHGSTTPLFILTPDTKLFILQELSCQPKEFRRAVEEGPDGRRDAELGAGRPGRCHRGYRYQLGTEGDEAMEEGRQK